MRPVSDAFGRTVRGSHRMVAEARIVAPGQTGVNPTGTTIPIITGDVTLDGTAEIRSTLDLTTDGNGTWPTTPAGLLHPATGNEIWARRGIAYGNGTVEWVSLGYHRILRVDQDDAPTGPIRVDAQDRMAGLIEAKLTAPRSWRPSNTYGQVITDLVTEVYPWATIEWDDTTSDQPIGRALVVDEDRHGAAADLVRAVGKTWSWDYRGVLVIRTAPAPTAPVFEVNSGAGGVLVRLSRQTTREGVYNAVVATGEAPGDTPPVRAVAVDLNPASPTYWYGTFGKVPRFYSSPLITTIAQAKAAAEAMLARQIGLPYSVDFTSVPHPGLEPDDPVRVRYPGRSETHVLDRITIPLTAGTALTAQTREQTATTVRSL